MVLGICCNMLPMAYCFGIHPGMAWILGLPAATWLVYLLDHVLDSVSNPDAISERHQFVRNYMWQIVGLIVALLGLCLYLLFSFYSPVLFVSAITISFFCVLFFVLTGIKNQSFRYFYNKELMVACVYASALYLPVGLIHPHNWIWPLFFACLLLNTYLSLLMMSVIDLPVDSQHHQFSWVMMIGSKRATRLFFMLLTTTTILCLYLVFTTDDCLRNLAISYLLMTLAHGVLFRYHKQVGDIRKWSEIIFWLPALVWLLY